MTTSADPSGTDASPEDPVGEPVNPDGAPAAQVTDGQRRSEHQGGLDHMLRGPAGADGSVTPLAPARKRPKPGERRVQILHTLAGMLQEPGADRITTAALAAKLAVSEATLRRLRGVSASRWRWPAYLLGEAPV